MLHRISVLSLFFAAVITNEHEQPPPSVQPGFANPGRGRISGHTCFSHLLSPLRLPRSSSWWFWCSKSNPHHPSFIRHKAAGKFTTFVHAGLIHHFNHDHSAIFLLTKVTADSPTISHYHLFSTNGASVVPCVLKGGLWHLLFCSTDGGGGGQKSVAEEKRWTSS